ncbi:MAG: head GIN domain-containing protein [Bacteroidota bacterium]
MKINKSILILLFSVFALVASAQKTITPESFDGLFVTGNIEVMLEKGTENKVELYVDGMPYDKVSVKVQRGILRLRVLESWLYRDEVIRAYVTYKDLNNIRANAGATVESEDLLKSSYFKVKATSGARIALSVEVANLEGGATEGGILNLEGSADKQDMQVATGAEYDGTYLDAKKTYIRTNTGGRATVVALELLEAAANTGGSIWYKGDPEVKNVKTVIAGEVRRY